MASYTDNRNALFASKSDGKAPPSKTKATPKAPLSLGGPSAAAVAKKQEQEAAEVEERRKRLEELYKKEQEAWAASPKKEPVEDDLERARKIDARRKEEQSEAREIARARLEAYRRAQTPEYRAAERLKQMHRHGGSSALRALVVS